MILVATHGPTSRNIPPLPPLFDLEAMKVRSTALHTSIDFISSVTPTQGVLRQHAAHVDQRKIGSVS